MAVGVVVGGAVDVGGSLVGDAGGAPNGCCRTKTCGGLPATGVLNTLWLSASPWDL